MHIKVYYVDDIHVLKYLKDDLYNNTNKNDDHMGKSCVGILIFFKLVYRI
jgi:hypothetical protein